MSAARRIGRDEVRTLVLHVLLRGPSHGYAIARSVEHDSGDALRLEEGTLYSVLRAPGAAGAGDRASGTVAETDTSTVCSASSYGSAKPTGRPSRRVRRGWSRGWPGTTRGGDQGGTR